MHGKKQPWVFRGSLQKYINTTCHYYATRPEKKLSIHMQIQPLNLSSRHECNFSGRPQTLASLRIKRNNFRDWIVESGRSRRHRFSRPDQIGFVRLEALVACAQAALTIKHKASLKRTLITTFYIFVFHVPDWGNPRWRTSWTLYLSLIDIEDFKVAPIMAESWTLYFFYTHTTHPEMLPMLQWSSCHHTSK